MRFASCAESFGFLHGLLGALQLRGQRPRFAAFLSLSNSVNQLPETCAVVCVAQRKRPPRSLDDPPNLFLEKHCVVNQRIDALALKIAKYAQVSAVMYLQLVEGGKIRPKRTTR